MKATVLSGSIDSKVQRRSEKSDQHPLGKGSHRQNSSICGFDATVLTEALPQPCGRTLATTRVFVKASKHQSSNSTWVFLAFDSSWPSGGNIDREVWPGLSSGCVLEPMSKDEAKAMRVLKRRGIVKSFSGKLNYSPTPEDCNWYRIDSVTL